MQPGSLHQDPYRDVRRYSSVIIYTHFPPFQAAQPGVELELDPVSPCGHGKRHPRHGRKVLQLGPDLHPAPTVTTVGLVAPSSAPPSPTDAPSTHPAEPQPSWRGPGPGEPHRVSTHTRGSQWLCKPRTWRQHLPVPRCSAFQRLPRAVPWQSPDAGVTGSWGELSPDPAGGWGTKGNNPATEPPPLSFLSVQVSHLPIT